MGFALLLLCIAIFANGVASAADAPSVQDDLCFIPPILTRSPPESNGQPVQVQIGVLLIDVVEINDVTESFTADFKVRIRWKDPRLSVAALGQWNGIFLQSFCVLQHGLNFHSLTNYQVRKAWISRMLFLSLKMPDSLVLTVWS
ncbi:MAG: hypothetical protein OET79_12670 [Nitrospirota bacterium]|nr:hypothetical protein [Nitrospirota bacterium]